MTHTPETMREACHRASVLAGERHAGLSSSVVTDGICAAIRALPLPPAPPIEEMEAALRPFAEFAGSYEPVDDDDDEICWHAESTPTLSQLRAARTALAALDAWRAKGGV